MVVVPCMSATSRPAAAWPRSAGWPRRSPTSSARCPTRRCTSSPPRGQARGGSSISSWFTDDVDVADAGTIVDLMRQALEPGRGDHPDPCSRRRDGPCRPEDTAFSLRDARSSSRRWRCRDRRRSGPERRLDEAFSHEVRRPMTGVYANFLGRRGRGPGPRGLPARRPTSPSRRSSAATTRRTSSGATRTSGRTDGRNAGRPGGDERRRSRARAAASSIPRATQAGSRRLPRRRRVPA